MSLTTISVNAAPNAAEQPLSVLVVVVSSGDIQTFWGPAHARSHALFAWDMALPLMTNRWPDFKKDLRAKPLA